MVAVVCVVPDVVLVPDEPPPDDVAVPLPPDVDPEVGADVSCDKAIDEKKIGELIVENSRIKTTISARRLHINKF